MATQAPRIAAHRDNAAWLQNVAARNRILGNLDLSRLGIIAARAYRLTLPAQSIIGA